MDSINQPAMGNMSTVTALEAIMRMPITRPRIGGGTRSPNSELKGGIVTELAKERMAVNTST